MKAEAGLESNLEVNLPGPDSPEESRGLGRLRTMLTEMRISTLMRLYRFASLALSSVLFLWFPGPYHLYTQLGLIFLVLATGILMIFLYEHFWNKTSIVSLLVLAEIVGISMLLAFTGGFNGPFLWYALNPFIVASAFFSFTLAWLVLAFLFAGTFISEQYFYFANMAQPSILFSGYHPILNLVVIALIIHMYARMHMMMSERLMERSSQQRELMSAQESLSANYQVFKGLSNFQREVVSYNNPKDIYQTLVSTVLNIFPLRHAVVLIPPLDFQPLPQHRSDEGSKTPFAFQVISPGRDKNGARHGSHQAGTGTALGRAESCRGQAAGHQRKQALDSPPPVGSRQSYNRCFHRVAQTQDQPPFLCRKPLPVHPFYRANHGVAVHVQAKRTGFAAYFGGLRGC